MPNVDLEKLESLLNVLSERNIVEFEHEANGVRIRVVRGGDGQLVAQAGPSAARGAAPLHGGGVVNMAPGANAALASAAAEESDIVDVTSPFVGTFYRAPSPDTPTFVEVGSVVRSGQTLCIIEAMKLMNEIEAECSGTVVEVVAQNGKAVEFGQKLFRIKKA